MRAPAMTAGFDSHIWLDPDNAKVIGAHLAQVLSAHYPEHAAQFSANAARLAENIDALTAELETATRPLRDKPFIVFHDAYGYFDVRFGLDAVGSITISPDVQPSAKRLTELRQKIRALGAVSAFSPSHFSSRPSSPPSPRRRRRGPAPSTRRGWGCSRVRSSISR